MKNFSSIFDGAVPDDFHELFAAKAQSFAAGYPSVLLFRFQSLADVPVSGILDRIL